MRYSFSSLAAPRAAVLLLAASLLPAGGMMIAPAHAQGLDLSQLDQLVQQSTNELAVQINLAGRQRMLTQKMTKEAMLVALDVDAARNRENLRQTMMLFERTLNGLLNGDSQQKLAAAPNEDVAAQLRKVMQLWQQFRPALEAVLNGAPGPQTLQALARGNLPLLREMNKAVKLYEQLAGTDTAEMAIRINLAGRQRMLTQKMTKEYLLAALGIDAEQNRRNMQASAALFERTLKGLLDGDDELGLAATKDDAVRTQLKKVMALWQAFRPLLDQTPNRDNLQQLAADNLPLLAEMNRAVKMLEERW